MTVGNNAILNFMLVSYVSTDLAVIIMSYAKFKNCRDLQSCATLCGCNHEPVATFVCSIGQVAENSIEFYYHVMYRAVVHITNYHHFQPCVIFHLGLASASFRVRDKKCFILMTAIVPAKLGQAFQILTDFPVECLRLEYENWEVIRI